MQNKLHQDNTLWRISADRSELALLVLDEVSMLRITPEVNDDGSIVRLAGRLADELVSEAERVCLSAEAPLLIDATGLQEADSDGLALLAKILAGGRRIENPIEVSRDARQGASRWGRVLKCDKPRATPGLRGERSAAADIHTQRVSSVTFD